LLFEPMTMTPHLPIYMDYGATTPVDPRVVDAMIPWLREHFGNPASRSHAYGWEAEAAVEQAREQVAALLATDPARVVFTSGGTESNNLAVHVARIARPERPASWAISRRAVGEAMALQPPRSSKSSSNTVLRGAGIAAVGGSGAAAIVGSDDMSGNTMRSRIRSRRTGDMEDGYSWGL